MSGREVRFGDLAPLVGSVLEGVTADGDRVELLLVEAVEFEPGPRSAPGFSVDLRIPSDRGVRPQQTIRVTVTGAGVIELFLVPADADDDGVVYQATVTRLPE